MKHYILFLVIFLACNGLTRAQSFTLTGEVTDTVNSPIPYTTVSLLHPEDSTLAFFGITNAQGSVEIKEMKAGSYLLQAAFLGFKTYYRHVDVSASSNYLGKIILKRLPNLLDEVEVKTEKVPITIKRDTVEYNASSFKTKPDANTEDLLKKLPGVQVDKAGNIKAQGEDVRKVLVDGKPFFSDDPKVATKNLPADAIKKVQVFNKHSDASEFTGIDDGLREKTINLQLKDDKKNGYFGDVQAGYGTDDRYKFSGKIYRFKPKSQFAALGMLNNINQFGFSFQDYLTFSGGISSLMRNGGFNINLGDKNAPPIDFGQPVYGQITSGAVGLNYTYEPKRNRRINVSYMGNSTDKQLTENSNTVNFTSAGNFERKGNNNEHAQNLAHHLNINSRLDKDSASQFTAAAGINLSNGETNDRSYTSSLLENIAINNLDSRINDKGKNVSGNAALSYLINSRNKKSVFKSSANFNYQQQLNTSDWNNITNIIATSTINTDTRSQHDNTISRQYSGNISWLRTLGKGYFIEPSISAGNDLERFARVQKLTAAGDKVVDSLSPDFSRSYIDIDPGISLRKSSKKVQMNFTLKAEAGFLSRKFNGRDTANRKFLYAVPSFNWQNEYSNGKRLNAYYTSDVKAPGAIQLLPVTDYTNPLQLYTGNSNLVPEYAHNIGVGWLWFDQFSFSSLFVNVNGKYTADKITWARNINSDLTQTMKPVNVPYDYEARGRIEYSRPIPKTGATANASIEEQYNRGISIINTTDNILDKFNHKFDLSFSNKKKEKWDVTIGGTVSITDAKYSVNKSYNSRFNSFTGYGEISLRPNTHWYFQVSADVTQYNAQSFSEAILVPLLKSEVSFYFLKLNRGTLTLEGFDLLNKNTGIQRVSQLNFLSETRSNIISRYFMLSFKYRINKTGGGGMNKIDIKTR